MFYQASCFPRLWGWMAPTTQMLVFQTCLLLFFASISGGNSLASVRSLWETVHVSVSQFCGSPGSRWFFDKWHWLIGFMVMKNLPGLVNVNKKLWKKTHSLIINQRTMYGHDFNSYVNVCQRVGGSWTTNIQLGLRFATCPSESCCYLTAMSLEWCDTVGQPSQKCRTLQFGQLW